MPAKAKSPPAAPAKAESSPALAASAVPVIATSQPIPGLHHEFEDFIDGLGLRFFHGREFTEYWTRWRNGVQNECPPQGIWHRIVPTLVVLDRIRLEAGVPIRLNSTYRCQRYNKAVGGEPNSFHMSFKAVDFSSPQASARELHAIAKSMRGQVFTLPGNGGNFRFAGGIGLYVASGFVHIDCRGSNADWKGN